jgi:DNA-binding transcriptional MerR regulator
MNFSEKELSVDHFRKLGLSDLEQLYTLKIIPFMQSSLETACLLLESDQEGKEIPAQRQKGIALAKKLLSLYSDHTVKEASLITALRTRQIKRESAEMAEKIAHLKKAHQQMRICLDQLNALSEKCSASDECTSLHKLGFAHLNNLGQDISRLFFLEEEYLFPRLPVLIH